MVIKPNKGERKPKKIGVQMKLIPSWAKNIFLAVETCCRLESIRQIRKNEIPIKKYKSVHTGPKSQLGGEKAGLLRVAYHVGIA